MFEILNSTGNGLVSEIPGSDVLLTGNTDVGYYGLVPTQDFIKPSILGGMFAIGGTINEDTPWVKMAYKNKIIFYPLKVIHTSVTSAAMNSSNIQNGSRTITIRGRPYSVRSMACIVNEPYGGGTVPGGTAILGTEYTDLVCRMTNATTTVEVGDKLGSFTPAEMGIMSTWSRSAGTSNRTVAIGTAADITVIERPATNVGRGWRPVLELRGYVV